MKTVSLVTADDLYQKLKAIAVDNPICTYSFERCEQITPIINEILELKAEKNALILAHTYIHPDIIYGVADNVGDSYSLAKKARDTQCNLIVFPSVRFMAETAKIMNPEKVVIDPNPNGGCSLADSISEDDVHLLRKKYPDHTFVCYINTTAAVKAASDICVTSSNVYRIIEALPSKKIYFLPDKLMGENIKYQLHLKGIDKEILTYPGRCYVHEQFDVEAIDLLRAQHEGLHVLAHPECKNEVIKNADFVGSTSEMHSYVTAHQDQENPFLLLSECGVASRLSIEAPKARLVGGCMLCKYMRSNSLNEILKALKNPIGIEIDDEILTKARTCINRMFQYAE